MTMTESFAYGQTVKGRRSRPALKLRFTDPNGRVVDEDAAKLLAGLIKRSPLTLAEIAERAEVCHGTVSRLLYGDTTRPHAITLARIAGVFGYVLVFQRVQ